MDYQIVVSVLVSLVSGGLGGAVLNQFFLKRRSRMELTLKLTESFFSMYPQVSKAKTLLAFADKIEVKSDNYNNMIMVGDWFNLVADLYRQNYLDRRLFHVGLISELLYFQKLLLARPELPFQELAEAWTALASFPNR